MRSNVFESAAVALHRCGYSVLPILSPDASHSGRGKAPGEYKGCSADGTKGPWWGLQGWEQYCEECAPEAKVAAWGRMADFYSGGLGIACGYGGLIAIDVDHPDLIEPIRAILPPIVVAKVGRKGFTAFFRGDHPRDGDDNEQWWAKKNYGFEIPDPDHLGKQKRVGLLDFLAVGSQTVLPPSRHRDTGEPYRWITERTLLNTPLESLPLFTDEHRAAMEEALRAHGWDAPEPRVVRSKAVEKPVRVSAGPVRFDDDVNAAALANLSAWVPALGLPKTRPNGVGYRAVAPWRGSGSGRSESRRGTNLSFHPTGIRDFGIEDGLRPVDVVAKTHGVSYSEAYAWLRIELGLNNEPPIALSGRNSESMATPSQDNRLPLTESEEKVVNVIDSFFDEVVPAYFAWSNAFELDATAPRRTMLPPRTQAWVVRVEMGIGKTHTAILTTAKHSRRHRQVVYALPEHKVAGEVAAKFETQGIRVAIYRGAGQKDPRDATKDMCLNPKARAAAEALGIGVRKAVCVGTTGVRARCPFAGECGVEWQRTLQPQLWIVPSSLLMIHRPDFIPKPDAIVIDEQFHEASIEEPKVIEIDTLLTALTPKTLRHNERSALAAGRETLLAAILANGYGPLTRAAILDQGISMEQAGFRTLSFGPWTPS